MQDRLRFQIEIKFYLLVPQAPSGFSRPEVQSSHPSCSAFQPKAVQNSAVPQLLGRLRRYLFSLNASVRTLTKSNKEVRARKTIISDEGRSECM